MKNGDLYFNGQLISSGEYLNGKIWKGKGKEYNNNRLYFEGEYLNGKRHGKGKEYYTLEEIKKILREKRKKKILNCY